MGSNALQGSDKLIQFNPDHRQIDKIILKKSLQKHVQLIFTVVVYIYVVMFKVNLKAIFLCLLSIKNSRSGTVLWEFVRNIMLIGLDCCLHLTG